MQLMNACIGRQAGMRTLTACASQGNTRATRSAQAVSKGLGARAGTLCSFTAHVKCAAPHAAHWQMRS